MLLLSDEEGDASSSSSLSSASSSEEMEEAGESEGEEESENDEEENEEEREEAGEEQGEERDGTKKRKRLDVAEYRTEFNGPERATAYAASWNRTMTRFPRVVWKPSETTFRGEIKFTGHRFGMGSYPNEEDGGRAMDALARLLRNKYPELDIFPEEAMNYPGQRAQATDIRRINKSLIKIHRLVEKKCNTYFPSTPSNLDRWRRQDQPGSGQTQAASRGAKAPLRAFAQSPRRRDRGAVF